MPEYPAEGELVLCKIKSIEKYGVFAELLEYNKEGFIHVSKITSGWVKNIRSHVSEGQLRVASVIKVDKQKNLIDLSMRKVNPTQERRKMDEWKRNKHAMKVFTRACTALNEKFDDAVKEIVPQLEKEHGDLYAAFEACSLEGVAALKNTKASEKWKKALVEEAKKSISKPSVSIRGKLIMTFYSPNGAELIKDVGQKITSDQVELKYISAPEYLLSVTATDYPTAEKMLEEALKHVEKAVKSAGGAYEFKRE
jgi:translation initiation factor 2 subunit 1